jgi:tricorn protease
LESIMPTIAPLLTASLGLALAFTSLPTASAADGYLTQPALHGDTLVFVSEGDLWVARLPGGAGQGSERVTAYRLTNGAGSEGNPILSPDGTRVAFAAEYEGNRDVYVMPLAGGAPTRVTYHPGSDQPLAWSPDGRQITFRSARGNPLGRQELWTVSADGGLAERIPIGEGSLLSFDPQGGGERFAFCRWSNEGWNWKRYRGGTAPEIWLGDLTKGTFTNLTGDRANDLFPMWIGDRVWFASDRDGATNLWSMRPDGSDLQQGTRFRNDASRPTATETYELRWPSADAAGAGRIAFAQGGTIGLFDAASGAVRTLDIDLVSDRAGTRQRFVDALANVSDYSLSPDGDRILIETRGELLTIPVGVPKAGVQGGPRQLTNESRSREWGANWLSAEEILCVSDADGEQQLARVAADGSAIPLILTQDRAQWLLRPVTAPGGRFVAFGDKDLRLWLMDIASRKAIEVDRSAAGEIVDYAFSGDGEWLAWSKPTPTGMNVIRLRSVRDGSTIDLSDGLTNDREPRFDPKGAYLWFLSDRTLNPIIAGPDMQDVCTEMTDLIAVSLQAKVPPPSPRLAAAAGFDLKKWAEPVKAAEEAEEEKGREDGREGAAAKEDAKAEPAKAATAGEQVQLHEPGEDEDEPPLVIEAAGIRERLWRTPLEAGNYEQLVPAAGGVWVLRTPTRGIADVAWPAPPLGEPIGTLLRFTALDGETKEVVGGIPSYAATPGGRTVAWFKDGVFTVHGGGEEKDRTVDPKGVQVRVDPPAEWRQMLDEAWRLQRDFYWAPNMTGVNWPAMRERYAALLPKVGTRSELNDVLGQLLSELGTSHTYVMAPGDEPDRAKRVSGGLLGADFARTGNAVTIASVLPGRPGDDELVSPLAFPHLAVKPGSVLLSIDGRPVRPDRDPYELLLDRAGRPVSLEIADDATGTNRRTVEVTAIESEQPLRYAQWVEANRLAVDKASGGRLGYLHVPDMDTAGMIEFTRLFYPQVNKDGLVIDIRDNGGGWVSQLLLERLARKPWANQVPRQGSVESYPKRVLDGPFVVLIDQNAGSDGDIFPESIRINKLAPLIGTRTWGGVVGIRGDKPSMDLGLTTQPEYSWFDPKRGWSVENDGVAPDIEVDITPADRMAGRDPQLAKGIEMLLEELKRAPRSKPTPPAFPDRSGGPSSR